jgi:hypothetical protein
VPAAIDIAPEAVGPLPIYIAVALASPFAKFSFQSFEQTSICAFDWIELTVILPVVKIVLVVNNDVQDVGDAIVHVPVAAPMVTKPVEVAFNFNAFDEVAILEPPILMSPVRAAFVPKYRRPVVASFAT